MSRSALLLLLFAACAAPQQRRELRDGAPMRTPVVEPRTTYTPTGAGLSEYWAEPDAPKPERSPYTRVLPQTPETMKGPGIWAAKEPSLPPLPSIVGVTPPMPTGADVLDYVVALAKCSATSDEALRNIGAGGFTVHQYAMQRQPLAQRRCLAARLLVSCARAAQSQSWSPDPRAPDRMSPAAADALVAYAKALLEKWCEGVELDPTLTKAHRQIEKMVFPRLETQ